MAKNFIPEVAKELGVGINEIFKIRYLKPDFIPSEIYSFTESDLMAHSTVSSSWFRDESTLRDIIVGDAEIVKLPWQPKRSQVYWSPNNTFTSCGASTWNDSAVDFALKEAGMVFKSKEECIAALDALRAKYLGKAGEAE